MYQGFEPRGIYDRYEKINELLHRAAVTAEPLELPLVRLKLVRLQLAGREINLLILRVMVLFYQFFT